MSAHQEHGRAKIRELFFPLKQLLSLKELTDLITTFSRCLNHSSSQPFLYLSTWFYSDKLEMRPLPPIKTLSILHSLQEGFLFAFVLLTQVTM